MLRLFYPSNYVESAFSIDYQKLYLLGYRGIIFDIDNTLVPHGADASEEAEQLFALVHKIGFQTVLLSDNGVKRIQRFVKNIDTQYIDNAKKPSPKGYNAALSLLGLDKDKVIYIGDQIFTDILGANLTGIDSILVKYIGYYEDGDKGKRRAAESKILKLYRKSKYASSLGKIER